MEQHSLKSAYNSLLWQISEEFSRITDKQGEWTSDYELWVTEYEAWLPTDMLYIVDKHVSLAERYGDENSTFEERLELLNEDIDNWIDYNVDVATFGISYINLKSWLLGAPRLSEERLAHLKMLKRELDSESAMYMDEFGKLRTSPQPKHLEELKHKKK